MPLTLARYPHAANLRAQDGHGLMAGFLRGSKSETIRKANSASIKDCMKVPFGKWPGLSLHGTAIQSASKRMVEPRSDLSRHARVG